MSNGASDPGFAFSFIARVLQNDSLKKGVAAAVAGLLVAAVSEAIWPSS